MRAWLLAGGLLFALSTACKEVGSSGQDARPLPAPEPPATSGAALPRDQALSVPKRKAAGDESDTGDKARRPAGGEPEAKPASGATTATGAAAVPAGSDAAATATSPSPLPSSVPQLAAPSAACLSRCQGALQGCLSTPVDGGVPGFGNLELCKKAFEACQSACSK